MKILSIEITNIKGIKYHKFDLDLIPNKPNLLVAPNGFGKSSFSVAFQSLNTKRIELDDKNLHLNDEANKPEIILTFQDDGNTVKIIGNESSNNIKDIFDVFVINSQLIAKATLLKFGGKSIAKSSMEIEPTILVSTIPQFVTFEYNYTAAKKSFGDSGKILPSINNILKCAPLLYDINHSIDLFRFDQVYVGKAMNNIFDQIKLQTGTANEIKNWIKNNRLSDLKAVEELNRLAELLKNFDSSDIVDETDRFLAAYQIVELAKSMKGDFRKASIYIDYLAKKEEYTEMIKSVNSTRHDIKPNSLIVEWPKAHQISNGQRDVLSFMALLLKTRSVFKKRDCILIIDEIFDYLDEGNLITFQYFITEMIEKMKSEGRNFFPILLTHLDPLFFNHFCFNKHKIKVIFLKDAGMKSNPNLLKFIRKREEQSIKDLAGKHHLHYHPTHIDLSVDFDGLGLLKQWGESKQFHQFIEVQVNNYLNETSYDPLAICIGVRIKIESILYGNITDPNMKQTFIDTHNTKKKLDYCELIGLNVPEYFYLLGIVYNDNLHLHNDADITKPLAIKLENFAIRKMIKSIWSN
jgi:hypothetical protein